MFLRLGLTLCAVALATAVPRLGAQQDTAVASTNGALSALENVTAPPDRPKHALGPAGASAKYPLQVRLLSGRTSYQGDHFYKGRGVLVLDGARRSFHYGCPDAVILSGTDYPSRWQKADAKLEIALQKANGKGTTTCTLTLAQR